MAAGGGGGLRLVLLAHGALDHARSPHTLWLAWYLVRQHGCAVLAVDHLPHHGVRTPYGSATADAWPSADLSSEDSSWGPARWRETLRRAGSELGFAMDVVLALPSAAEMGRQNDVRQRAHEAKEAREEQMEQERRGEQAEMRRHWGVHTGGTRTEEDERGDERPKREYRGDVGVGGWLYKLVDRPRARLVGVADEEGRRGLIDPSCVCLVGNGLGVSLLT